MNAHRERLDRDRDRRVSKTRRNPNPHTRTQNGFALVIILGLLVIILGLAVTFLNKVTVERGASASYADAATTRQFADTAVNLVQGQIHRASTLGINVAWASQPGMIRTFGTGSPGNYTASGSTLLNFKLYSAPDMVTSGTNFTGDVPPGAWDDPSNAGLWTDLNAPVRGVYPILAPQPTTGGAEQFSITSAPGATTAQPVPMPVRWLYVLQDGKIVAPGGSGNAVTVAGAATSNPIVGRIAFWTDDETCKVNINTASEGTFWDTPRAVSAQEKVLAKFQPAQKEFQRYPGHPAMTSLSAVFPSLTPDEIYGIVPRIIGGGSNGGTVQMTATSPPLVPDADRLYASVDELVFQPGRGSATNPLTQAQVDAARFFLTASSRAPEVTLFDTPRIAIWPIDSDSSTAYRTAFDRLIAFCATINGQPYYFQRHDPKSATDDYNTIPRNQELYGYLQKLTDAPFPGFGGNSFATKFGMNERDQILTEMFDYIRSTNLDDSTIAVEANRYADRAEVPSTVAGRGKGFGQVVPIRIGATQGFGRFPVISEAGIHFIATADGGASAAIATAGGILGSNVAANKTLERDIPANPTQGKPLAENQRRIEALFFVELFVPAHGWPSLIPAYSMRVRGLDGFQINAIPLGFPADATVLSNNQSIIIVGGHEWGGSASPRTRLANARMPARGVMPADPPPAGSSTPDMSNYALVSIPVTVDSTTNTMIFTGATLTVDVYPRSLTTTPGYPTGTVPVNTYTLNFPGGTFPIPTLANPATPLVPNMTKENWWTFSYDGCGLISSSPANLPDGGWSVTPAVSNGRPYFVWGNAGALLSPNDVVRTVVPANSDFRLLAASPVIPASAFVPHPLFTSTQNLAHSIVESSYSNPTAFGGTFASTLLADGVTYNSNTLPDVAISSAASDTNGDWDNGIAYCPDGPFINKPDEGNSLNAGAGAIPYFDNGYAYDSVGNGMFSPNRQMPSAGMFGSLSSGVNASAPYRTLLFRPQSGHPGDTAPRDHLWTDLYWMPVVEPYAISEPFSTAGKINMNYQILPFTYIRRATGMAALLHSGQVMAIPNTSGVDYKDRYSTNTTTLRHPINIPETLSQFDTIFSSGTIFKSASQIMELHLVPDTGGATAAGMPAFWNSHKLTGDNTRERPYTNLLGRLTTKSNTYTVHYRVQALKKSPSTDVGKWDESHDKITGESRGSTTIERYIQPNDTSIPEYGSSGAPLNELPLSNFYRWRIVNAREFSP